MASLHIKTAIALEHKVLDKSGKLSFKVLYGLFRPSKDDPRPIILDTRKSLLNVPYALAQGLLTLEVEEGAEENLHIPEALHKRHRHHDAADQEASYLVLPYTGDRAGGWRKNMIVYEYRIEKDSALASMLRSRRKYSFRMPRGGHIAMGRYVSSDSEGILTDKTRIQHLYETAEDHADLVISVSLGKCSFSVVQTLPWPPELVTNLVFVEATSTTTTDNESNATETPQSTVSQSSGPAAVYLKVTTTNAGSETISVQTRGQPRFLYTETIWGMESNYTYWARIIDTVGPYASPTFLRIIDRSTGRVLRCPPPRIELGGSAPGGCGRGVKGKPDHRPLLSHMLTLEPGRPVVRRVEISRALRDLPDGRYGVGLEPRGMWWCPGDPHAHFAAIINGGDGRVPWQLWREKIPPAMLESEDVAWCRIENGEVVGED